MKINDLIFSTYELGGRGPDRFDCYGLFLEIQKRLGRDLSDLGSIEDLALRDARVKEGAKDWQRIDTPRPWCAVALRIGRYVSHVGVVLDDGARFMHMNEEQGVVIERLDCPKWAQRIEGFYVHE